MIRKFIDILSVFDIMHNMKIQINIQNRLNSTVRIFKILPFLLILAFITLNICFSATSYGITGLEIMQRAKDREDGDNQTSDLTMILIDKKGKKRIRKIRSFQKDFGEDGRSIMFFTDPADVKNTGFLTYDYDAKGKDDDQWLYLPALRKTKRIGGTDKSGSFMGSDFNYSDMSEPDLSDYSYKLIKELEIDGNKVWQVEAVPINNEIADEIGYSKSIMFVRQDNDIIIRAIKYVYKKKNRKKYMMINKLEKIDGIWVASESQMVTKEGKTKIHSTIMSNDNIKFNQDISDNFFTKRQLEKGM